MRKEKIRIWEAEEYSYGMAYGFVPNLTAYLHEEADGPRPCMIVVPGGAYSFASIREGQPVAERFYGMGYNAFVLTYTCNPLRMEPLRLQPLRDLARAVRLLRKEADRLEIDSDRIAVCGFSAGGHLTASLAVHGRDVYEDNPVYRDYSCRPDALVLSYPVITAEPGLTHADSIKALLGYNRPEEDAAAAVISRKGALPGCRTPEDEMRYMSLETQVCPDTPPVYIWHTLPDDSVPVENTFRFEQALREKGVLHSMHIYSHGVHGLSLADQAWADRACKADYTLEQVGRVMEQLDAGHIPMKEEEKDFWMREYLYGPYAGEKEKGVPVPEVQGWPEMAHDFLRYVFGLDREPVQQT